MTQNQTKTPKTELLHELFGAATHDASAAMCRWTSGLITLSLDEVLEVPLEEVAGQLGIGSDLLMMVVLTLDEEIGGTMVLTFDDVNGRRLAAALLSRPVAGGSEWDELQQSALCETGNILGCAYMNALTRIVPVDLVPSAPYFVKDYGASVLQQALMVQADEHDQVLLCRTGFHCEGEQLNWHVIFVPSNRLRTLLEHALDAR